MKLIVVVIFCFIQIFISNDVTDFDNELSHIAEEFTRGIMDEDECENQQSAVKDLIDEIEDAIDDGVDYSSNEIIQLKKLKQEAEALKEFINAVLGDVGFYTASVKDFNALSFRMKADVSYQNDDEYCVNIIKIRINNYIAYFVENDTSKNYRLLYKWKTQNRIFQGNGEVGLLKNNVGLIYDNRENIDQKTISVYGVICQEFLSNY